MVRAWIGLAGLLWACGDDNAEPVRDASRPVDAAVVDAAEAARTDAAISDAGVPDEPDAGPPRSWMDVPPGPAAKGREACKRSWSWPSMTQTGPDNTMGARVFYPKLVVDDAGAIYVAAYVTGDVDFGTGLIPIPYGPRKTIVVKLDADCSVAWVKVLDPASPNIWRKPMALGLTEDQDLTLVTQSNDVDISALPLKTESGAVDILRLRSADGSVASERSYPAGPWQEIQHAEANRHGVLLVSGLTAVEPVDFGMGTLVQDDGGQYNALFGADGVVRRNEAFGLGLPQFTQRLGASSELLIYIQDANTDFYEAPIAARTLLAIDAKGKRAWSKPIDSLAVSLSALAEDGSSATTELDRANQHTDVRVRARDGSVLWELPIQGNAQYDFSPQGVAPGPDGTFALFGGVKGPFQAGHSEVDLEPMSYVVLSLWRGGAVRWVSSVPANDYVDQVATTASGEVIALSIAFDGGMSIRKLVAE